MEITKVGQPDSGFSIGPRDAWESQFYGPTRRFAIPPRSSKRTRALAFKLFRPRRVYGTRAQTKEMDGPKRSAESAGVIIRPSSPPGAARWQCARSTASGIVRSACDASLKPRHRSYSIHYQNDFERTSDPEETVARWRNWCGAGKVAISGSRRPARKISTRARDASISALQSGIIRCGRGDEDEVIRRYANSESDRSVQSVGAEGF